MRTATSTAERDALTSLESLINKTKASKDSVMRDVIPNCLNGYTLKSIFRFSLQSPAIEGFFKMDVKMNQYWAKRLHEINCFDAPIVTMGGQLFSTYDQLYAAYQYQESHKRKNELAEGASFHAMSERLVQSQNIIEDFLSLPRDERTLDQVAELKNLCGELTKEAEVFMQQYWALGAIRAGVALFCVADFYADLAGIDLQVERAQLSDDAYLQSIKNLLIEACRYFYVAYLLDPSNIPNDRLSKVKNVLEMSQAIVKYYYSGKGLLADTAGYFNNWSEEFDHYLNGQLVSFGCSVLLMNDIKKKALGQALETVKKAESRLLAARNVK
jgi:hypothetical protein